MRIGLTGRGATVDDLIEQGERSERDGFTSLWYAYLLEGDPLAAMTVVGRATSSIELGTAVLQTYPCHPLLQANRVSAASAAMARAGLTLGVGPSHRHIVEGVYGLPFDHPGRSTEEYVQILAPLLRGETVDFEGEDWTVHSANRMVPPGYPVSLLLSAMSPRLLRVAGQHAAGTITWMATPDAVATHIAPRVQAAAVEAGRPAPRVVAGLPVAVHDNVDEARAAAAKTTAAYAQLPSYMRIIERGGSADAASAAVVGSPTAVRAQLEALLEAGATDIWAGIFAVGENAEASERRTYETLAELVN
jgi:F420-dependent oxidoreductase-like protein